jgi:hypothetical protein
MAARLLDVGSLTANLNPVRIVSRTGSVRNLLQNQRLSLIFYLLYLLPLGQHPKSSVNLHTSRLCSANFLVSMRARDYYHHTRLGSLEILTKSKSSSSTPF